MNKNEQRREWVSRGVIGLLVGLPLLLAGLWSVCELHVVWNVWPTADGVVTAGAVRQISEVPFAKGGIPVDRYTADIQFQFTENGQSHSAQIPSGYLADTSDEASAYLQRTYSPGTHHPIRYNPRDVSDVQLGDVALTPLVFSFLLMAGGVAISVWSLKWLASGYANPIEEMSANVLAMPSSGKFPADPASEEVAPATRRCPACGRPVKVTDDSCPNCLRFLHAA